jgi:lysophospholipase L1-like esterase
VATVGAGVIGVIGVCLALLIWVVAAPGPTGAAAAGPRDGGTRAAAPGREPPAPPVRARVAAERDTLAACEARLEDDPDGLPTVAVVGASYTAGVGPDEAARSWAVLLARELRWNAVVYGVPGVGYVRAGAGDHGPVIRMLARLGLSALDPALVIVQAGHDDSGVPASLERQRVGQVIAAIRAAAPRARIALLTVFTGPSGPSPSLDQTNDAIIAAARAADPGVIIMDPLAGWSFGHAHGGLHPTAAGDAWIAARAEAIVRAHGVVPAVAGSDPVICDSGIGGGRGGRSGHGGRGGRGGHGSHGAHGSGDVRGKAL